MKPYAKSFGIPLVAAAMGLVLSATGAQATVTAAGGGTPEGAPIKPGATISQTPGTPDQGSLNARQMEIHDYISGWEKTHPRALGVVSVNSFTLEVTLPVVTGKLASPVLNELTSGIKSKFPEAKVVVATAEISDEDLDELVDEARADSSLKAAGVQSINRNDSNSGIAGNVDSANLNAASKVAETKYGKRLTLRVKSEVRTNSRQHDAAPYYSGIPINRGPISGECTAGPRVNKAGFGKYMLTAAHCSDYATGVYWYHPAAPNNTNVQIGYVSAVSTAADAELVTGSYYPYMWIGSPSSTTYHAVRRVVSEGVGTVICADGERTGQVCRTTIQNLDYVSNGVHLVKACNATTSPAQPGDSGGNIYHVDSAGLLYYHGMIDAVDTSNTSTNRCVYYVPMYRLESALGITLDVS